jgi:hypothetical protein
MKWLAPSLSVVGCRSAQSLTARVTCAIHLGKSAQSFDISYIIDTSIGKHLGILESTDSRANITQM